MADDSFPLKYVADDLENVNEGFDASKENDNLLNNELSSDSDDDKGSTGFGIFTGAIFIVSVVAGTGVLVLPVAIANTGWYGLLILAVVGVTQTYTGILLGRCWVILQERFELYRRQTRYPYAAIGYESFGPIGRFIVTVVIDVNLIGIGVAFLLIISRNIEILLKLEYLEVCTILPMVALALCPLVWFGTPKDFWFIAVGGAVSTGLASIILVISILLEAPQAQPQVDVQYNPPSYWSLAVGVGLISVSMVGHSVYPTIQHDMRKPADFSRSMILSFLIVTSYYLPLTFVAYYVYGDYLRNKESVFEVLQPSPTKTIPLLLITMHVVCGFVVLLNPVFQDVEELIGMGTDFSWKRALTRTLLVAVTLFIAASVPDFSKILSFLGGTLFTILSMIFPPVMYIRLCSMRNPTWPNRNLSTFDYIIISVVIVGSTILVLAVTVANFKSIEISDTENFTSNTPCYLQHW